MSEPNVTLELEFNNTTKHDRIPLEFIMNRDQNLVDENTTYDVSLIRFRLPSRGIMPFGGNMQYPAYLGMQYTNSSTYENDGVVSKVDFQTMKQCSSTNHIIDHYNLLLLECFHKIVRKDHANYTYKLPDRFGSPNFSGGSDFINLRNITESANACTNIYFSNIEITFSSGSEIGGYQLTITHPVTGDEIIILNNIKRDEGISGLDIADFVQNETRTEKRPYQAFMNLYNKVEGDFLNKSWKVSLKHPKHGVSYNAEVNFDFSITYVHNDAPVFAPYFTLDKDLLLSLNYSTAFAFSGMSVIFNQSGLTLLPMPYIQKTNLDKVHTEVIPLLSTSSSFVEFISFDFKTLTTDEVFYAIQTSGHTAKRKADGTLTITTVNDRTITQPKPTPNAYNNITKLLLQTNLEIVPEVLSGSLRAFEKILTDINVDGIDPESYDFTQNTIQNRKYRFIGKDVLNLRLRPTIARSEGDNELIYTYPGEYGSIKIAFYPVA